jgi:recombination protein RecA
MSFGHGIDEVAGVLDMAMSFDVVTKRGAWFSFGTEQLGQGRVKTMDLLREQPDLLQKIKDAVLKAKSSGAKPVLPVDMIKGNPDEGAETSETSEDTDGLDIGKDGARVEDV